MALLACLLPLAQACDDVAVDDPPPPPPPPVYCPLCGEELPAGTDLSHRPLMVSIDNHPAARPQAGLTDACVVFEVLAEGGITRLLPVFVHGLTERVGPVRSARHYFLDLSEGLDALYTHAGQSPQAIVDLRKLKVPDLNEFELEEAFWRESERKAPHNLYTSIPMLRTVAPAKKGYRVVRDETGARWPYRWGQKGTEWKGEAKTGFELTWPYSSGRNKVGFQWQAQSTTAPVPGDIGFYTRTVNGEPHIDQETQTQLTATNVIVAFAKFWRIPGDTEGRLDADLTGSGKAVVYSGGRALEVTWRKADRESPLVFVDEAGELLWLPAGQTWILFVPSGTEVTQLVAAPK